MSNDSKSCCASFRCFFLAWDLYKVASVEESMIYNSFVWFLHLQDSLTVSQFNFSSVPHKDGQRLRTDLAAMGRHTCQERVENVYTTSK